MSWIEDDFSGPCDGTDDNFLMSDAQKSKTARWADKLELWYFLGLSICAPHKMREEQTKTLDLAAQDKLLGRLSVHKKCVHLKQPHALQKIHG